jgi:hypothetical protein
MSVNLSPIFNAVAQTTSTGLPLNGGLLYTYQAGSSTPLATYADNLGTIANTNPLTLGTDGRPQVEIWLQAAYNYKFVLTDALGNLIGTYDNISGLSSYYGPSTAVTSVTGTSPISVSSGTTPNVSLSGVIGRTSGGTGVASPAVFFAHQSLAQAFTNATVSVITYNVADIDTNSWFVSSNNSFTPQVAGYYQVNVSCSFASTSTGYQCGVGVGVSGTLKDYNVAASSSTGTSGTDGTTPVCSTIVYCNGTTDYIQGFAAQSSGGSLSTVAGISNATTFSVAFLRGA